MENISKQTKSLVKVDSDSKLGTAVDDFVASLADGETLTDIHIVLGMETHGEKRGSKFYGCEFTTFVGDISKQFPDLPH